MGLFGPLWMTNSEKKEEKAVDAVWNISDVEELLVIARDAPLKRVRFTAANKINDIAALKRIANDAAYDDNLRLVALQKLAAAQDNFDVTPYAALVEPFVRQSIGNHFQIAVSLTNDLDLLESMYDKLSDSVSAQIRQRDLQCLCARTNQLATDKLKGDPDTALLERIATGALYDRSVKKATQELLNPAIAPEGASQQELLEAACTHPQAREDLLPRLTDEQLLYQFITRVALLGSADDFVSIVERISNTELLASIARNEALAFSARAKAASLAGVNDAFGTRTLVCKTCGKPIMYEEWFEKDSRESWNTVAQFSCTSGCWKTDNLANRINAIELKDVAPEALQGGLLFLCPTCLNLRGYTTYREPSKLKVCSCSSTLTAIPLRASLTQW